MALRPRSSAFLLPLIMLGVAAVACGSDPPSTFTPGEPDAGPPPCSGSLTRCGANCVDLASVTNCGSCDNACVTAELCCAGSCAGTSDCSFAVGSVEPKKGPMNGALWITLKGAGFQPGAKVFIGDARAPARTLSPTEIRVEVPPGPAGLADIRVEQAGRTSAKRQAFEYVTGKLAPPWKVIPLQKLRGENPGLTLLQSGQVMIAGGTTVADSHKDSLASVELFERSKETVTEQPNPMGSIRMQNAAITLLDGRVFLFGGSCDSTVTAPPACTTNAKLAEIYDPKTGTIRPTAGSLQNLRIYPRAVLLPDGRVFISSANDATVEVYDPDADAFTLIPHANRHVFGFAARMRDGRVLFGGGDEATTGAGGNKTVDIFDPETNSIKPAASLAQGRSMLTVHTLVDGRVAVVGGSSESGGAIRVPLDSIELYDPKADSWSTSPLKLSVGRTWHASSLVSDGSIVAMGGYTINGQCNSSVGTVDRIDFIKGMVEPFAPLPDNKKAVEWNALTLLDGSIVAVGGGACGTGSALPEIYFLPGAAGPK
jgi:hypothetical protein